MVGGEVSDETDTRAGRLRRDRLPRNRQRERVLRMVREHGGAVDAVELASQIGLHVTTVRFHLDALCDDGLIVRTRLNRPSAGRPRTGYLAVEERLDYRVLADLLAMELGQSEETRARRAEHAGQKWAARIPASPGIGTDPGKGTPEGIANDALDQVAVHATVVFTRMGFAPELIPATKPPPPVPADSDSTAGRERTIRLHACPVRDLARSHPEVVCGVHRGLLQGLLSDPTGDRRGRNAQQPAMSAHLEPFVEPELCVARLVAR
jgi:predicted ArsR family transcriptional regulator